MTKGPGGRAQSDRDKPGLAARQAAATVLTRIVDDGRGIDGLLESQQAVPAITQLSDADRGLVRAIVTTACRHRGEIDAALGRLMRSKPPKNARHLIHTLHVAAAQILFMDIPDSAAVDLAVTSLSADKRSTRFASLGNAVLRRMAREKAAFTEALDPSERARLNMPDWLFRTLKKGFGRERAMATAMAHMHEPVLDLTVRSDAAGWAERLGGSVLSPWSIRVPQAGDLSQWPGFEAGEWWVQDFAATLPARLLGDIEGKRVVDLCAAPGGKTAQLAAAGAKVTAIEQSAPRLMRLRNNMKRLGLDVECVEADLFEHVTGEPYDAVLLDAPCSSTGTIRRHPDVQWTKSAADIEMLAALQKRMVEHAAGMVAEGGTLVFANCSIARAEGEDIAASLDLDALGLEPVAVSAQEIGGFDTFINGQGNLRTLPSQLTGISVPDGSPLDPARMQGLDGFFAARFRKR